MSEEVDGVALEAESDGGVDASGTPVWVWPNSSLSTANSSPEVCSRAYLSAECTEVGGLGWELLGVGVFGGVAEGLFAGGPSEVAGGRLDVHLRPHRFSARWVCLDSPAVGEGGHQEEAAAGFGVRGGGGGREVGVAFAAGVGHLDAEFAGQGGGA